MTELWLAFQRQISLHWYFKKRTDNRLLRNKRRLWQIYGISDWTNNVASNLARQLHGVHPKHIETVRRLKQQQNLAKFNICDNYVPLKVVRANNDRQHPA